MSQEVDLKRLETLIGRWAPRLLELINDLRAQGIKVNVSLGLPWERVTGPGDVEVTVTISLSVE